MEQKAWITRRALLATAAFGALVAPARAVTGVDKAGDPAGTVKRIKGAALAVRDALPRVLAPGDPVFIGDVLSTGPDARLEVAMIDDGVFTLGERTSFVIIDYTFGGDGNPVLRLLSGAVNAATGAFTAKAGGMRVETEVATIGIRGTKFWVGDIHGLMHVAHWQGGGLTVDNRAGGVLLDGPDLGSEIKDAATAPTAPKPWPKDMTDMARAMTAF